MRRWFQRKNLSKMSPTRHCTYPNFSPRVTDLVACNYWNIRTCHVNRSGVPRRGLSGLEPPPPSPHWRMLLEINVSECVKMFFKQKSTKKILGRGPSPDPSHSGEGDTPSPVPTTHPLRRLRYLNPSHSKILGTPLVKL